MKWSEDGSEVTMSKEEFAEYRRIVYFQCHCGWKTEAGGGPFADPPQCPLCECYTFTEAERGTFWDTDKHCIKKQREERYPYLETVVSYIESLPHKNVNSYVKKKVGTQFNLTQEEVHNVLVEITLMQWDKADHGYPCPERREFKAQV